MAECDAAGAEEHRPPRQLSVAGALVVAGPLLTASDGPTPHHSDSGLAWEVSVYAVSCLFPWSAITRTQMMHHLDRQIAELSCHPQDQCDA